MFGFAPFGQTLQATLILEYSIPATIAGGGHGPRERVARPPRSFPSRPSSTTRPCRRSRSASRRAARRRDAPNGSALGQIRTNDFFAFSARGSSVSSTSTPTSGMLVPAPVALTPDRSFNFTAALGRFVLANEPAILAEKHTVPLTFEGAPFQGGNVDRLGLLHVAGAGREPGDAHQFARNTCNGCHTFSETGGAEFQVQPRFQGQESQLSPFLTGADVTDSIAGVIRHFNELGRRGRILHGFVCPQEMLPPPPPDTTPIGGGMGGFGGTGGAVGGRGGGSTRHRRHDRRPRRRHADGRRRHDRRRDGRRG